MGICQTRGIEPVQPFHQGNVQIEVRKFSVPDHIAWSAERTGPTFPSVDPCPHPYFTLTIVSLWLYVHSYPCLTVV